ncbi:MAG: nuclear transport factor 2 family protein [Deltaproteobacteria bacterium]|nr:nuclear transport factor 2 family protein [Deltaproteobacteria bacterium]
MKLSKEEIIDALSKWNQAWDMYDLDGVMALFHKDIIFDNWTGGQAKGKENLHKAWDPWFKNNQGFKFTGEDTFIDVDEQKVLYQWHLDWPSMEKGYEGKLETRRGIDVMHFENGKIVQKLTYSKTTIEIEGKKVKLLAGLSG